MKTTSKAHFRGLCFYCLKSYRLKVDKVALGVVFDAGDVVIYPVWLPLIERKLGDLFLLTFSSKGRMACIMSVTSLAGRTAGVLVSFMDVTILLSSCFPWKE